jgi:two-component system LytT family response regulator
MKVKCLLVDDEPLAIQLIQNHLAQLDSFEVVATCSNAVKALEILRSTPVDLLFLDIKMPKLTGLDFLKSLKNPPAVIITTAYREYALEGYDLDLVDYLLKPITFDRFFKAIDRYLRSKGAVKQELSVTEDQSFIHVRSAGKIHRLHADGIMHIESVKDYIVIHLTNKKITAKYKIGDLETEIKSKSFLRIHRSFIVNLPKITAFTVNHVEIGGIEIPIGSSYKENVLKILQSNTFSR